MLNNGGFRDGGVVNGGSSIIAGNTNLNSPGKDFGSNLTSPDYNIIGNTAGTNITDHTSGNQLMLIRNACRCALNGGSLMTHALAPNSPAIDKGRGFIRRFDFSEIPNTNTGRDIGAFERQPGDGNPFGTNGDKPAPNAFVS